MQNKMEGMDAYFYRNLRLAILVALHIAALHTLCKYRQSLHDPKH